jgi:HMG (high mobility group) box
LPPEEKERYHRISCEDRDRYESEKALYNGPWKISAADSNIIKPKKPAAPFVEYMRSVRPQVAPLHPDKTGDQLTRVVAQMWKDASPSVRHGYISAYRQKLAQHKLDLEGWSERRRSDEMDARESLDGSNNSVEDTSLGGMSNQSAAVAPALSSLDDSKLSISQRHEMHKASQIICFPTLPDQKPAASSGPPMFNSALTERTDLSYGGSATRMYSHSDSSPSNNRPAASLLNKSPSHAYSGINTHHSGANSSAVAASSFSYDYSQYIARAQTEPAGLHMEHDSFGKVQKTPSEYISLLSMNDSLIHTPTNHTLNYTAQTSRF